VLVLLLADADTEALEAPALVVMLIGPVFVEGRKFQSNSPKLHTFKTLSSLQLPLDNGMLCPT
jgi:hypothetical protein